MKYRVNFYVCERIGNAAPQDPPVAGTDIRIANASGQPRLPITTKENDHE